jgi:hypothetical protein
VTFSNGREVLLQNLNAGVTAVVIALMSDLTEVTGRKTSRSLIDA